MYIISYIYISFSLYLLTSVTHLKCHRDQNRTTFWWNSWQSYTRYKTRDSVFSYIIQLIFQVFFMYKELLYQEKKKKDKVGYAS